MNSNNSPENLKSQDQIVHAEHTADFGNESTSGAVPSGAALFPFLTPPTVDGDLGTFGEYRVTALLGEGGMGFVFRAEDEALQRPVALKVMRPEVAAKPGATERFLREARAVAKVKSEHVVTIYQVGKVNGVPFLAMEFLAGMTLEQWLAAQTRPVPAAVALRVARETLQGLAAAHEHGLVHRDIKPANLWLEKPRGKVKVIDFGLTRGQDGADQVTADGVVIGTPAYMAPEQAAGHPVDARADVFSAGAVLFRILAGKSPFQRKGMMATLAAVISDPPPNLATLRADIPAPVARFVDRLLAKDPAGRPATAQAAITELIAMEAPSQKTTGAALALPVEVKPAASQWEFEDGPGPEPKRRLPDRRTKKGAPPRMPKYWLAGLLGFVAMVALGGTVIIIRNKDGSVTELKVPKDATVEVKKDGNIVLKITPKSDPPARKSGLKPGEVAEVVIGDGVRMQFCWIPPGEAQLGSPAAERQEVFDKHLKVDTPPDWLQSEAEELRGKFKTKGFWLGKYPVTQQEWAAVTGKNPSAFVPTASQMTAAGITNTDRFPVDTVSWHNCQEFLAKLDASAKVPAAAGAGKFALPHEDQWEYACRGGLGNKQAYYFGDSLNGKLANCDGSVPFHAPAGLHLKRTSEVGAYEKLAPHPWGLADMISNVRQWCRNLYGNSASYVIRGGCFDTQCPFCRSASGYYLLPNTLSNYVGLRVVCEATPKAEPKPGAEMQVEIAKGVGMTFCWMPAGEAQLGSPKAERQEVFDKHIKVDQMPAWLLSEDEELRGTHKTDGFWLGKFPVTQQEWQTIMGDNPSWFVATQADVAKAGIKDTSRFPVESVSWDDSQRFMKKLTLATKLPAVMGKGRFCLPHEDEWEYACRGGKGNRQAFYFGDLLNGRLANCNGNTPFRTTLAGPNLARVSVVGSYEAVAPHPWGLCDMSGNLWQWCENFSGIGIDTANRELRGGCWNNNPHSCRSASRGTGSPSWSGFISGFRVCYSPE